jgi:hypothetical protein
MDHKSGSSPSTNGVVRDNVFVNGYTNAAGAGNCTGCTVTNNLFTSNGNSSGLAALVAVPSFVGGPNPTTYAGFVLAPGSPGRASASDGTDRGIRVAPAAAPAPAIKQSAVAKPKRGPRVTLRIRRRVSWAQLRRGLLVRVSTKVRARVSLRLDRQGSRRPLGWMSGKNPAGTRSYRLKARRGRLGPPHAQTVLLRVRVTNKAGRLTVKNIAIRVHR